MINRECVSKKCIAAAVLILMLAGAAFGQSVYFKPGERGIGGTAVYQKGDKIEAYSFALGISLGEELELAAFGGKTEFSDAFDQDFTSVGIALMCLTSASGPGSSTLLPGLRCSFQHNRLSDQRTTATGTVGIPIHLRVPTGRNSFIIPHFIGYYSMEIGGDGRHTGVLEAGVSFCTASSSGVVFAVTPGVAIDKDFVTLRASASLAIRTNRKAVNW